MSIIDTVFLLLFSTVFSRAGTDPAREVFSTVLLFLHQTEGGVDDDVGSEEFLEEVLAEDFLKLGEGAEFLWAKALLGKFGIEGADGFNDGSLVGNGSAMVFLQLITWEDDAGIGGISDGLLFEVLHPLFERR